MPPSPKGKLGILASGGLLPILIDRECVRTGRERFVVAFDGYADPADFKDTPHAVNRLGAGGRTLALLRDAGCKDIVLAGIMKRPRVSQLWPDWWGIKFILRTSAFKGGDDGLLRALVNAIEAEGFHVVGVDDVLPELLAPSGVLGAHQPTDADMADVRAALTAARNIGRADKGQAAIARGGQAIAEEDAAGTDAMLARVASARNGESGGVLAKALKPGQERRADLPAIGITTMENAHRAGLRGVAVETGNALIMDRAETIAKADALGLFLIGVEAGK